MFSIILTIFKEQVFFLNSFLPIRTFARDDVVSALDHDGEERVVAQDLAGCVDGDGSDSRNLAGLAGLGVAAQQGGVVDEDDDLHVVAAWQLRRDGNGLVGVPGRVPDRRRWGRRPAGSASR